MALRKTPIERWIAGDHLTPRQRYAEKRRALGFRRVIVEVPERDEERLKAYAARLRRQWEREQGG